MKCKLKEKEYTSKTIEITFESKEEEIAFHCIFNHAVITRSPGIKDFIDNEKIRNALNLDVEICNKQFQMLDKNIKDNSYL